MYGKKRHLLLESVRSYFVSFFADQTRAQIGRVRGKNPLAAAAAPRKRPVIFARFQACLHPFLLLFTAVGLLSTGPLVHSGAIH